jgi:Ca2+/Na+ antiporter
MQNSSSELGKFVYLLINVGLLALGAVLGRRVFAVFGGLGIAVYLGHLAHRVFQGSLLFPFALTLVGLGILATGIWWQRNEARLSASMRRRLPVGWKELLETRHESLASR